MKRSLILLILAAVWLCPAASEAFLPYAAMYKAFKDPRAYTVQASDKRLALEARAALLAADPGLVVDLSLDCYVGQVFLVGEVADAAAADKARRAVASLSGVRSVEAFLPVKGQTPGDASALQVRKALVGEEGGGALSLSVKAVGGTVVLMGMVSEPGDKDQAARAAAAVPGVTAVKDFLLVPEAGEGKRQGPAKRLLGRVRDR